MLAHFVDWDNVRVVQVSGSFGFDVKPLNKSSLRKPAMQQHLEGHDAVDGQLAGSVHHAHPATPDLAQ